MMPDRQFILYRSTIQKKGNLINPTKRMRFWYSFYLLIIAIFIIYQFPAFPKDQQQGISFFSTSPSQLTLTGCQPDLQYDLSFSIDLMTSDPQWVIYTLLNQTDKKMNLLESFYLVSSSSNKEEQFAPQKPLQLKEGSQPVPAQSKVGEFTLRFKPDWKAPTGKYQLELLFAYQSDSSVSPFPLPNKIPITVTLEPTVLLNLDVQPKTEMEFNIQGQPGLYASENRIILNGKANVGYLTIVCWSEDLKGKKGHIIPNSRIYLERTVGTKKNEMVPLDKPLEIKSFQIGEPISLVIEGFFIKTLLEDLPDEYEGQIHFDYIIPTNEKEK